MHDSLRQVRSTEQDDSLSSSAASWPYWLVTHTRKNSTENQQAENDIRQKRYLTVTGLLVFQVAFAIVLQGAPRWKEGRVNVQRLHATVAAAYKTIAAC